MITSIQPNIQSPKCSNIQAKKAVPSFGMARLNDLGRESADSFGYTQNEFLNADMFKKNGLFKKESLLSKELRKTGTTFQAVCEEYGCSNNAKTNAEFIVNQILSPKSSKALSQLSDEDYSNGLMVLYQTNYDNPELSTKHTKELLDMLKDFMQVEDYIKNVGILAEGADK